MLLEDRQLTRSYFSVDQGFLLFGHRPGKLSQFIKNYSRPCYIYDLAIIEDRFKKMQSKLRGVQLFYAMKANSNLVILRLLKRLDAKIDVVSSGEIKRAFAAGFFPEDIVYSGVGKTVSDIEFALSQRIYQINVESLPELKRISEVAKRLQVKANISLRLNPNISIDTHPYIATGLHENKFGIELSSLSEIKLLLKNQIEWLELRGISLHLGSQMKEFSGFKEALQILKREYLNLKVDFPTMERFDFGGGLGIDYESLNLQAEEQYLQNYSQLIFAELGDLNCELQSEPGRWIVARSGILLTQIQYVKKTPYRTFIIVDSGMNHLLRPALYQAHHNILTYRQDRIGKAELFDVVGPICESADFFAKDCQLNFCQQDEFLVIADVGAYGYSMANIYNLQDLPEEKFL